MSKSKSDADANNVNVNEEKNATVAQTTTENVDEEGSSDEYEDIDGESVTSSTTTSRSKSPNVRRRSRRKVKKTKIAKPLYKYSCHMREDHAQPIFGVQFNKYLSKEQAIFASVGSNRIGIYECPLNDEGGIKLIQVYADPDPEENFYTCAWSYNIDTKQPVLAVAGLRGVIRVLDPVRYVCVQHHIGHGHAINELKFHPKLPSLLLSGSKDHSLRLWNIQTQVCVAVFGGVEGHRDEVLSVDFNMTGSCIMSAGMDHSLKLWRLDKTDIKNTIESSLTFKINKNSLLFNTRKEHFPDFSTRDVHRNYVDCVQWFGNFLLSKSCENEIVCWKPGKLNQTDLKPSDSTATILHRFLIKDCDIWFIRFDFNFAQQVMALGNQQGKTYVWEMNKEDPQLTKSFILSHSKCNTAIRQTTFSRTGGVLICACDDGTIWRWDRAT